MISQKTIDEIFSSAQIDEVVGDFVSLKRRGRNMIGLCPFHNERTPSFTVSPSKNIYKCFGCGRGGNPVQFVMEHEQMSYPEALRYLANKYDIKIEETRQSPEDELAKSEREGMLIVNEYARDFFVRSLMETDMGKSVGLSYLKKRDLSETVIDKFELGYSPADGSSWTTWAKNNAINVETSQKLGLTNSKGTDFFRGRVMFPIHNVSGKVIAFAGRTLSTDKRSPKYINSPETLVYDKSRVLYGMHLAKRAIGQEDECLLVEGYTDVISLHMQGVENVVASSGTSLTDGQVRLIKRFTPNVVILYDGDDAGKKAALRGIDILLQQDMNVKVVLLPGGHDPDSFIREKGVNGFKVFLSEEAEDFIIFKSRHLLAESKRDPVRQTVLIKEIIKSIALIPDALKQSLYLRQVSEMFEVREELLSDILADLERSQKKQNDRRTGRPTEVKRENIVKKTQEAEVIRNDVYQERDILRILIGLGDRHFAGEEEFTVGQFILANLEDILEDEDLFDYPLFLKIVRMYQSELDKGSSPGPQFFVAHQDPEISKEAVDLLAEKHVYSDNWAKRHDIHLNTQETPELNFKNDCQSGILRLKLKKINKLIKQNEQKMTTLDISQADYENQFKVVLEIHSRLVYQRNEIALMLNQVII